MIPADAAFVAAGTKGQCKGCVVVNKMEACYEHLGACAFLAKVYDPATGDTFEVALNQAGQAMGMDSKGLSAIEAQQAYLESGPVNKDLGQALMDAGPDWKVPVVVWLRTYEAPFDREDVAADPAFAEEVALAHSTAVKNVQQAFADAVSEKAGVKAWLYDEAPAVFVEVTQAQALWVSSLEQVAAMYLWEAGMPLATSWYDTDKAGCTQCNNAPSVPVCFVEKYRPDTESTLTISDHYIDPPGGLTSWHSRFVTGFVRSTASQGGGIADQSTNYMGNWGGGSDRGGAMNWCGGKGARVWSHTSSTLTGDDRLFDYWARHYPYPFIAGSAGNSGQSGTTHNAGFNVMCVGGSNDQGNSTRSNDTIYSNSSSKNPSSTHGDRELPVIVAPGQSVTSAGITTSGTSASAAQVAGAAAQIQYHNSSLRYWPEAQRAILMATADENVHGPVLDLTDTTDDRDGAGELNIELAMSMAGSAYKVNGGNTPIQAGHDYGTMNFSNDFDANGYYDEVYKVTFPFSGKRTRVVLTWDSTASCTDSSDPSSCTSDTLDADLDLYVSLGGRWVTYSTSWDNSYEFVEFDVSPNVTYEIRVKLNSSNASSTYFGLAWNTWTYGQ